jgi:hypothetical protein
MHAAKFVLSILATVLAVICGAAMAGVVHVTPDGISGLLAVSGALATFGIQLLPIPPAWARGFGAVSLVIAVALGTHYAFLTAAIAAHAWIGTLMHWVGLLGLVLGYAGHLSGPAAPPAPPPGPPTPAAAH